MHPSRGHAESAEIDASGNYTLDVPAPGTYMLLVQSGGGGGEMGSRLDVTVPAGVTELRHDIELPSGEISGVAFDAETGEGVAGAQVMAFTSGAGTGSLFALFRGVQGHAVTDGQGRFILMGISPGSFSVVVASPAHAEARVEGVRVGRRGGPQDVRIPLEKGITVRASVKNAEGAPVAQAMAFLRGANGDLLNLTRPGSSGTDGKLEITGVKPGIYRMTVVHRTHAAGEARVEAVPDGPEVEVVLRDGGRIAAQVVDASGKPVEGCVIEVIEPGGANILEDRLPLTLGSGQAGETGRDGSILLEHIPAGTFRVAASRDEARSREERVKIEDGETSNVRVTLDE